MDSNDFAIANLDCLDDCFAETKEERDGESESSEDCLLSLLRDIKKNGVCDKDYAKFWNVTHKKNCGSAVTSTVTLDQEKGLILSGGDSKTFGNVYAENKNGVFGPVCDDNWSTNEAKVACKQLDMDFSDGIPTTRSLFGIVPSKFALDDVSCNGAEKELKNCSHATEDNCGSYEGAGVICYKKQDDPKYIVLRAADGSEAVETGGTIEGNVFARRSGDEYIGPVCDYNWQDKEARVVCKQLGYQSGQATRNSKYGDVPPVFALQGVSCNGYENDIQSCGQIYFRSHDYDYNYDYENYDPVSSYCTSVRVGAGVICSNSATTTLELQGGIIAGDEVAYGNLFATNSQGVFGPVCDDRWNSIMAKAVCTQLKFEQGFPLIHSEFGPDFTPHSMLPSSCDENAKTLSNQDCTISEYSNDTSPPFYCGPEDIAGVYCYNEKDGTGKLSSQSRRQTIQSNYPTLTL